jgi:hypothetical protein
MNEYVVDTIGSDDDPVQLVCPDAGEAGGGVCTRAVFIRAPDVIEARKYVEALVRELGVPILTYAPFSLCKPAAPSPLTWETKEQKHVG